MRTSQQIRKGVGRKEFNRDNTLTIGPTRCFSFSSMGPGYFRHAQMSAVTPRKKIPPQH
jgi:hypothetical protein